MNLTIKPIDADNAKGYVNNQDCLGATAVKRVFQTQDVRCRGADLEVNGTRYIMSKRLKYFLMKWPLCPSGIAGMTVKRKIKAQLPKTFRLTVAKCQ